MARGDPVERLLSLAPPSAGNVSYSQYVLQFIAFALWPARVLGWADGLLFFVANDAEGPAPQIRALTQLGEPSGAQAVLLDIPDDGGFYTLGGALSADALAGFLKAYKAKELPRKQLQK